MKTFAFPFVLIVTADTLAHAKDWMKRAKLPAGMQPDDLLEPAELTLATGTPRSLLETHRRELELHVMENRAEARRIEYLSQMREREIEKRVRIGAILTTAEAVKYLMAGWPLVAPGSSLCSRYHFQRDGAGHGGPTRNVAGPAARAALQKLKDQIVADTRDWRSTVYTYKGRDPKKCQCPLCADQRKLVRLTGDDGEPQRTIPCPHCCPRFP